MDRGLPIVPVNGYGIKIYDKAPAESTGPGGRNLVGVPCQTGGLSRQDVKRLDVKRLDVTRLDVKAAGKRYRVRG
jgi:hypothetical protein